MGKVKEFLLLGAVAMLSATNAYSYDFREVCNNSVGTATVYGECQAGRKPAACMDDSGNLLSCSGITTPLRTLCISPSDVS